MASTKHLKSKGSSPFADDSQDNPEIGQSKGLFATGDAPEEIEGASTVEGDVLSDSEPAGGVDPEQSGRINK